MCVCVVNQIGCMKETIFKNLLKFSKIKVGPILCVSNACIWSRLDTITPGGSLSVIFVFRWVAHGDGYFLKPILSEAMEPDLGVAFMSCDLGLGWEGPSSPPLDATIDLLQGRQTTVEQPGWFVETKQSLSRGQCKP